jgi:hypothetical protein
MIDFQQDCTDDECAAKPASLPESLGVFGGGVREQRENLSILQQVQRVLLSGWVDPRGRSAIARQLARDAQDKSLKPRDRARAALALERMTHADRQLAVSLFGPMVARQIETSHASSTEALIALTSDRAVVEAIEAELLGDSEAQQADFR